MPKKTSRKTVHYVQLRTYRQWSNPLTYKSHLEGYHSKLQPITSDIDRLLNTKWIDIRRPEIIFQLSGIHREDIQKNFLHQTNLIDYKYFCLQNQSDENDQLIRQIFLRFDEISHSLFDSYEQIERNEREIYEYRLTILKEEFEQEREALKDLFVEQELKELDKQINVLSALEEEDVLHQSIQFQLQKRQLEENFVKDISILQTHFQTKSTFLQSTLEKIVIIFMKKTRQTKDRIDQEMASNKILKRKVKETKESMNEIDRTQIPLHDQVNQLKQCTDDSRQMNPNPNQIIFRRLCVLADHVQKDCRRKLQKAERIFFFIRQCHRLEFDDEHLQNCHLELDFSSEELALLWKRFAHVQMDIYIRLQEKSSLQKYQKFFEKQLKNFI